jgi:hypothetical protein
MHAVNGAPAELDTQQRAVVHRDRPFGKEEPGRDLLRLRCLHSRSEPPLARIRQPRGRSRSGSQEKLRHRLALTAIGARETVLDDLRDGDHRDAMLLREQLEVGHARR